ncbi:MAG TPA: DUF971 domain-containing protein [Rhizomicrobium sp.]|jgi:DUF971 family protein|nr:DUF971 domain-containing protein [Rhizomicrobium sp.]
MTSWPSEVRLNPAKDMLTITFEDGARFALRAEYLRVESPSAEVKGHGGQRPAPVTGKQGVRIDGLEPVGNYALRIGFDDGHDSGLFSWDYLRRLGAEEAQLWAAYQDAVRRQEAT